MPDHVVVSSPVMLTQDGRQKTQALVIVTREGKGPIDLNPYIPALRPGWKRVSIDIMSILSDTALSAVVTDEEQATAPPPEPIKFREFL